MDMDPSDAFELARTAMPFVVEAIGAVGTRALDDAEDVAAKGAVGVGQRILGQVFRRDRDVSPGDKTAVEDVANNPGDAVYAAALETRVRKALLADAGLAETIREQLKAAGSTGAVSFEASNVYLGGEGGQSFGAGGGGGSGLGIGSHGGIGGRGGNVYLDGRPGETPGAGGGGGGVQDGGQAGEGGGGGEVVMRTFRAEDLPDEVPITIGVGGRGGRLGDGEDGGDTTFGDLIRARGGKGGQSGSLPMLRQPDARLPGMDISPSISTAILANYAEVRDGLCALVGGGWSNYVVPHFPHVLNGCLVIGVEFTTRQLGIPQSLRFELIDSDQQLICDCTVAISIPSPASDAVLRMIVDPIMFRADVKVPGVWTARAFLNENVEGAVQVSFEVKSA